MKHAGRAPKTMQSGRLRKMAARSLRQILKGSESDPSSNNSCVVKESR